MRTLQSLAISAALCVLAACNGSGPAATSAGKAPRIVLNSSTPRPTIDVVGVPPDQLAMIAGADSREAWTAILKVAGSAGQPPAVGQYSIDHNIVRFTPMFPLERGRQYDVTFTAPGAQPVTGRVGLPPPDTTPITSAEIFPSVDPLPVNVSRVYIHFSGPMGPRGGLDFLHLIDDSGKEVKDPFLSLDAGQWNEDRTQYAVAFDPERRALAEGQKYTLVVDYAWPDAKGLQLKQTVDHAFTVGPADDTSIDPKTWKVDAPSAETSQLVITFPEPLDYDSLQRAISVLSPAGKPVEGDVVVSNHELTWSFIPAEPWTPGSYNIAVAGLEDLAGNRIKGADSEKVVIPFSIR